jgi:hypothetical protein
MFGYLPVGSQAVEFPLRRGLALPILAMLGSLLLITGCGASSSASRDAPGNVRAAVRAAACPRVWPRRSSPGSPTALAPDDPVWTTFCIYNPNRNKHRLIDESYQPGGPLDSALNDSVTKSPAGSACADWLGSPMTVVLAYPRMTKHVAIRIGGCMTVVMSDGAQRPLPSGASQAVLHIYEKMQ